MNLVPLSQISITNADEYRPMLSVIEKHREGVSLAISQHGKSHTQFQYAMLDNAGPIAGPTKLRNMRQILSVIDQTEAALQESWFNCRKKMVEAAKFRRDANDDRVDDLDRELAAIQAEEIEQGLARSQKSTAGAIRKLAAYYEQYASLEAQLKQELGKDRITEADFEADEERFHIMKVFEQALCAARANGGRIDHGNMIYFHDIGINGGCAQGDIITYLQREADASTKLTDVHAMHSLECDFLADMAKKYEGCSVAYLKRKGLISASQSAVVLN
jgi:hypothetical protein